MCVPDLQFHTLHSLHTLLALMETRVSSFFQPALQRSCYLLWHALASNPLLTMSPLPHGRPCFLSDKKKESVGGRTGSGNNCLQNAHDVPALLHVALLLVCERCQLLVDSLLLIPRNWLLTLLLVLLAWLVSEGSIPATIYPAPSWFLSFRSLEYIHINIMDGAQVFHHRCYLLKQGKDLQLHTSLSLHSVHS